MTEFDKAYREIIRRVMTDGYEERNERTGHAVRALPGMTIEVEGGFPLLTLRRIPVKLFIAEQIWFLTGSRRPDDELQKFTHIWDDFANPGGVVTAAYGFRWRHQFGRDQIASLISLLERDPSSRHGVVIAWDPGSDGLGTGTARKNVPCPYTFTVNIIGDALHMHNILRSNDLMLGCPHDVAGFALLQRMLAARLGVRPGKYTHSISNAHIYDLHWAQARELLERDHEHPEITLDLPAETLARAEASDYALVGEIEARLSAQYHPMPNLKGLTLVV